MSWDARQRAMLQAMGLRVYARAELALAPEPEPEPELEPESEPAPSLVPRAAPARTVMAAPGGDDVASLREAVSGCRACGLSEQRRSVVFGKGSDAPRWLLLTEPPDEAADAAGQALADGPAARLLDNMLAAAGLSREQVFITPVVKCRPPRGRPASAEELTACAGVLARQIELLRPRLILALGRQAAQSLLGSTEPLGRLRGRTHQAHGLPVVATYDPAYLLRAPADKAGAWDDLCLALTTTP